jgi:hypothetical protein
MALDPLTPLTNVPISIFADGIEITGTILTLYPNDIEVEWNGQHKGLHVPYFTMFPAYRLATTENLIVTGFTERGRLHAEQLLLQLAGYTDLLPLPTPVLEPAPRRAVPATPVRRTTLREFLSRPDV